MPILTPLFHKGQNKKWSLLQPCNHYFPTLPFGPQESRGSCRANENTVNAPGGEGRLRNNMVPDKVPEELRNLTMLEEQLIARAHPIAKVHRKNGGQYRYSGHVINIAQAITTFAASLPWNKTPRMCPSSSSSRLMGESGKVATSSSLPLGCSVRWSI